jgi:transposase
MQPDISDLLVVAEVAEQYGVSQRTVERWIERGLDAQKATDEQILQLLERKRIRGLPPKGIWVIRRSDLKQIEQIRKPVGYPKGKPRPR